MTSPPGRAYSRVLIGTQARDVVVSHRFDDGGMFDGTAGVFIDGNRFRAFVKDGWGGGIQSKAHATQADAERDIERLKEKFYG